MNGSWADAAGKEIAEMQKLHSNPLPWRTMSNVIYRHFVKAGEPDEKEDEGK